MARNLMNRFRPLSLVVFAGLLLTLPVKAQQAGTPPLAEMFAAYDEEQTEEAKNVIINVVNFILYHEIGHMMISEFDLPMTGREEDSADMLATLILLEDPDENSDQVLSDTAFYRDLRQQYYDANDYEVPAWDSHSADAVRSYQILCMMVGHDGERFAEIADAYELPQERRDSCVFDYQRVSASWNSILEPYLREDDGESNITVTYEDYTNPNLETAANIYQEYRVLEELSDYIGTVYDWEDGLNFVARQCDVANAFWDPATRTVILCYEYAELNSIYFDMYMKSE